MLSTKGHIHQPFSCISALYNCISGLIHLFTYKRDVKNCDVEFTFHFESSDNYLSGLITFEWQISVRIVVCVIPSPAEIESGSA